MSDAKDLREQDRITKSAVNRLKNANKRKADDKEINKYQKPFLPNVPIWAKAFFIKWWFAGAICFFFFWGLGAVIQNQLDLMVILWLAIGVATDLLTNNVLRFIQLKKEYEPYMMFPARKYVTLFLNIFYAIPLMVLTILVYDLVNRTAIGVFGYDANMVVLGVEPVFFGIFYTAWDYLFLALRNRFIKR